MCREENKRKHQGQLHSLMGPHHWQLWVQRELNESAQVCFSFAPTSLRLRGSWETSRILGALFESNRWERVTGWCLVPWDQEVMAGSQEGCIGEKRQKKNSWSRAQSQELDCLGSNLVLKLTICMTLTKSLYLTVPPFSHL